MIFACLHDLDTTRRRISEGESLLIAGDESLIRQLPKGQWIGGTTPYFMTHLGGICTDKRLFLTELDDIAESIKIKRYDEKSIENIYTETPDNGFSFLIIPEGSKCHVRFALEAFNFDDFAMHPLIGWVSGTHLDERKTHKPKVYNGRTGECYEDEAVVMHIKLSSNNVAEVGILNMFEQGDGDTIAFAASGFNATKAYINGKLIDYAQYIKEQAIDLRMPLVADINGTLVNTSFRRCLGEHGEIRFHSPVFKELTYRHAKPIDNYSEKFTKELTLRLHEKTIFSCNCILNFIYSGLDKYSSSGLCGPATFGEIAYHLHNQTVVFLRIIKVRNNYRV